MSWSGSIQKKPSVLVPTPVLFIGKNNKTLLIEEKSKPLFFNKELVVELANLKGKKSSLFFYIRGKVGKTFFIRGKVIKPLLFDYFRENYKNPRL